MYLKNSMKEKPYPCCSAIPAQTTFADAPINVPLPEIIIKKKAPADVSAFYTFALPLN